MNAASRGPLFFVCPDIPQATGGIKVIYQDVATLRELGFDAQLVHFAPGFKCTWFPHEVPIQYAAQITPEMPALFVVPEIFGPNLHQELVEGGHRLEIAGRPVVVFNQNASYTFTRYGRPQSPPPDTPYLASNTLGALVVSEHSRAYLEAAFPGLTVRRKRNLINPDVFHADGGKPGNVVSFMSRKHPEQAMAVLHWLNYRGLLAGIKVVNIEGRTEAEVADILRSSSIFMSFGYPEGCPLPPAEALACGCVVVGYAGFGGVEYFDPRYTYQVPDADLLAFGQQMETALGALRRSPASFHERGREGSRFILERYSKENELADLQSIWTEFSTLAGSPPARTAARGPVAKATFEGFERVAEDRPTRSAYDLWKSRHTLQEIDGQIFAERMLLKWQFRPKFAIGTWVTEDTRGLLADTIDALARQWYPEWQLVVFAPGLEAPAELAGIAQIGWVSDPREPAGFAALQAARDADFYAMLPAGTTLDDHALQAIADEINASQGWLALYTDHDETGTGGTTPRFKPAFNPELLYSTDYIGPAAFVCREALQAFAGGGELSSSSPYGLLLQVYEQTGVATIGHIADPLVHLLAAGRDHTGEAQALERHLARCGRSAQIEDGWFEHTRRVRFAPRDGARVSVVALAHSQPGYLTRCLESLLETAGMPVAELILVAHQVTDGDLAALLARAAEGSFGVPCRVLQEPGAFAPAAFRNRAAGLAEGDYLLFVDDDVEFFQPGWLAALVGHAGACGLTAVGPRLVNTTDGPPRIVGGAQVLGLFGLAGNFADDRPGILDARHDLRLQLDQAVSALSAHCLLVDRAEFERMGGFDEATAPRVLHDVDFFIRLREAGRRAAWLASVDVIHQEGISVREACQSVADRAEWTIAIEREKEALLARHLPKLADDPSYNRHLSLRQPFVLDVEAVADWNPRFRERPRVLGVPLTTGAGQYRVVAPLMALARAGLAQCTIVHPIRDNTLRALMPAELARLAPDTAIVQNCIDDNLIAQLAASAKLHRSIRFINTIDDRLGDLPRDNPLHAIHARHGRTQLRKGLAHCDRLIVTTGPLREYCADLIDDIRVVPNRLETSVWKTLRVAVNRGARPRVGWVGAMQHGGDLKLLEPVVRELAGEVDWVFMGMCPQVLEPYVKEIHEFVSIRDYPAKMASLALDLALAPLEIHPFNECKSNLRLLEYGALAWPVICTDIDPYRTGGAPVTRLPNHHEAWTEAIRERIHDRENLRREGTLLQQWVYANYMLEDGLDDWLAAFCGD